MRKMIVVLGLTLALVSLFGLTAAISAPSTPAVPVSGGPDCDEHPDNPNCATNAPEPTSEPGCDPSGQNPQKCDTEEPPNPTATDIVEPTATEVVPPTATEVIEPTATEEGQPTPTEVIEPTATEEGQPTATLGRPTPTDDCIPGGGTEFAPCPTVTPTPKPHHHQETGPEDTPAIFGWLTTMGIGLASAGIAGMRRR